MDYLKGGRGKKAPYETEMYRIPTPIKETVRRLAIAWKQAYTEKPNFPSHLLNCVQSAIAKAACSEDGLPASTNLISTIDSEPNDTVEALEAIKELVSKWRRNSKDTRNWVEANRLLRELENQLNFSEE